jgi:ribosome assembly protein 1
MTSNPNAQAKGKKPLFVQFVLETLHNVYNTVLSGDKEKTEKVASVLNMKILPRDMKVRLLPAVSSHSVP